MSKALTKSELIELLACAKNSKERNKAVKLLKKFEPVQNLDYDDYGTKENLTIKEYKYVVAYMCPRCGKVKQCNNKAFWLIPMEDGKVKKWTICSACFSQLQEAQEVKKLRAQHQKANLVPKGFGFGLTDETGEV